MTLTNELKVENKKRSFVIFAVIHLAALFILPLLGYLKTDFGVWLMQPLISFGYYLILGILPIICFIRIGMRQSEFVILKIKQKVLKGFGIGFLIGIVVVIVFMAVNQFQFGIPDKDLLIKIILYATLAAMFEEIIFRGFYLQQADKRMGFTKANILISLIFAVLHIPSQLLSGGLLWQPLVMLMVISLWLGYLLKKTNSLWCVIIVHAAYNISASLFS